jgi:hypothetical protein
VEGWSADVSRKVCVKLAQRSMNPALTTQTRFEELSRMGIIPEPGKDYSKFTLRMQFFLSFPPFG